MKTVNLFEIFRILIGLVPTVIFTSKKINAYQTVRVHVYLT